jgi:uncharacterized protein (DUF427 family)
MALTFGKSPLARPPGGIYNFDLEAAAPGAILYLDDVPKRIRGRLAGETIVDTRRAKMLYESGQFPLWYLPVEDVRHGVLVPSGETASDPVKGERTAYDVHVGDRVEADAAWSFSGLPADGPPLDGLVAIDFDRLDAWLEEDEPIRGHPRDPYHRFDCRRTSEHVVVRVGGETVAETRRAVKLFETSIPPRYYLPRDDVAPGALAQSDRRDYCPYKGEAAYFHVTGGDTTVEDGAWVLPEPIGEADAVADHLSFWGEGTEVTADGEVVPV